MAKVIDGDTFKTDRGETVRLADVDAPELDESGGQKAKRDLEALIDGKTVTIKEEGESYGRIVADVKLGKVSVNDKMRR